MMKKALLLLFFVFTSTCIVASHFQGYDITIQRAQFDYKIILKIYRDNRTNNAAMPTNIALKLYRNNDNVKIGSDLSLPRIMLFNANYESDQNCLTPDAYTNLQVGVFEYLMTASLASSLNSPQGYYLSGDICCRNAGEGATNVENAFAYGALFTMDFPRLSSGSSTMFNSSPKFNKYPLLKYIVGKNYTIDWSATDIDGDSLVYKLAKPSDNGTYTKPFYEIDFKSGYGIGTNLADGNPDFQINSSTGIIIYKPTMAGSYIVAVKVEEYRNGIKIGEIRREMNFLTVISPEFAPIIHSNFDGSNDIVDTIDFPIGFTKTYNLIFNGKDVGDSVSMYVLPNISQGENIFDANTYKAEFGVLGNTQTGSAAMYQTGYKNDSVETEFKWNVSSFMGRNLPYTFKVVARDKTCPSSLTDTINVQLYVNYKRCFANDTMMYEQTGCDSVVMTLNNSIQTFYSDTVVMDTVSQQLNCDLIKTYLVRVKEGTDKPGITGDINITDTSTIYTYEAVYKNDVTQFEWNVSSNGTIVGGDGSAMIHVKWNAPGQENLKLIVYNRDNCSDSIDITVNVDHIVGVNQLKNNSFKIFPNPTSDKIFIKSSDNDELGIELYSIDGKLVMKSNITNELDISHLQKGVYILKVDDIVHRIVKM